MSILQSDHRTHPNILFIMENNVQNENVGTIVTSETAQKARVYGEGPLMEQFINGGIKINKENFVLMKNSKTMDIVKPATKKKKKKVLKSAPMKLYEKTKNSDPKT